ncbi:MAG TPA: phosphopantetheine-binding protein [Solirubrobacterales bacterium]|nr:phosphopantetheine-binding protein [Solirubrobacterales bacterium]
MPDGYPSLTSVDPREIRETLARFIDELLELPYDGADPLADEMVDSLGQEQLAEYIHEAYGVELSDEEMAKENFASLAALSALVAARC